MSLVGSLEDLGLGDILQIISLSRKSGTLWLRAQAGEGRISFREGNVCGAAVKGDQRDLRGVMLSAGLLSEADFDAAREQAQRRGVKLAEAICARPGVAREQFDQVCREAVESAVVEMFAWGSGEFNFVMGEEPDEARASEEGSILLTIGVNAQFVAMEAARQSDESGMDVAEAEVAADDPMSFADVAEEIRDAIEADSGDDPLAGIVEEEPSPAPPVMEAVAQQAVSDAEQAPTPAPVASVAIDVMSGSEPPPLVVVDAQLNALEWAKAALVDVFPSIHIFQRSELAVQRIRQYLARSEFPVVLVSVDAPGEPGSGADDAAALVSRLKSHAPRMRVLWMLPAGEQIEAGEADGVVYKPTRSQLGSSDCTEQAAALRNSLGLGAAAEASAEPSTSRSAQEILARLREISARISDPSSRGEVLELVMKFAAENFSRVAMFLAREERVCGLAQLGLSDTGGPDDAGLREIEFGVHEASWFQDVVTGREPVKSAPSNDADRVFTVRLGGGVPQEVYVAPLLGGDGVIAFLYADNLPGGEPIGDTSDLEVVLHQAGLAMERALLERTLAEAAES